MVSFIKMDRLQNPYQPGAGTRPPALIGRDDLIDEFGVTLRRTLSGRSGKSCMLVGLRGVGKTVLLNRFAEIAGAEGVKVGFIEASENGDFRTLLAVRLRRILLEWNGLVRRAVTTALGVLKSFTLKLPLGASISIGVDPLAGRADSGVLAEDLTDVLVAAGEAAAACESALMVVVDEVQYLSTDELAALVTAIHRTTQLGLPVILTGAGLPQLPALVGAARSYAERLFEFPVVSSLPPAEAAAAIVVPAHEFGVELASAAVDRVVAESGGYPYFLQEWGYHVWNAAPASPITGDDVRSARSGVIDTLDRDFFRVRFDRLTPKEKDYLRAMAVLGPDSHRSGDIAAALGVRVESVAPRRSGLIAKGMIYSPAHGDTAFTVPLFDHFLLRAMPGR